MIITVTLNPAVDRTMHVPKFCAGRVNRATSSRVDAGGKGINVSKALKELGCDSIACGLIAGRYGRMIKEQITAAGIKYDFVEVPGETRLNVKIISDDGTHTDINEPGAPADPDPLPGSGNGRFSAPAARSPPSPGRERRGTWGRR